MAKRFEEMGLTLRHYHQSNNVCDVESPVGTCFDVKSAGTGKETVSLYGVNLFTINKGRGKPFISDVAKAGEVHDARKRVARAARVENTN
jgi:hypothetical protein